MRYTTDTNEIQKFLVDRAAMEQDLALSLSKIFNAGQLHTKLNIAVWAAFLFLHGQWTEKDSHRDTLKEKIVTGYDRIKPGTTETERVKGVEQANSFLFPPGVSNIEGLLKEFEKGTRYTAEQCASLIRLYGEVIDTCKDMGPYWFEQRTRQIQWRYGGGGEAARIRLKEGMIEGGSFGEDRTRALENMLQSRIQQGKVPGGMSKLNKDFGTTQFAKADTGSVWQKVEGPKQVHWESGTTGWEKTETGKGPLGGRIRVKPGPYFNGKANPYYDLIPGNLFVNDEMAKLHFGFNPKAAGVMQWKIEDASTIGKIDRTFGLPYGADISGTTTDNLYFLTGWADVSSGDPIMMMLPIAAIVGEYHHALIETAAAMSLKKVISYSIGFYSTLAPSLPTGKQPAPQRNEIVGLLKGFEDRGTNKHILLHYDQTNKIAGCFIAEDAEWAPFKKMAEVHIGMWPKFQKMPPFPKLDNIYMLLDEIGLLNEAKAAYDRAQMQKGQRNLRSATGASEEARLRRLGLI